MIFEKSMENPMKSWSLSTNKFMFKDVNNSIFVLFMTEEVESKLYKVVIPKECQEVIEEQAMGGKLIQTMDYSEGYLFFVTRRSVFFYNLDREIERQVREHGPDKKIYRI